MSSASPVLFSNIDMSSSMKAAEDVDAIGSGIFPLLLFACNAEVGLSTELDDDDGALIGEK